MSWFARLKEEVRYHDVRYVEGPYGGPLTGMRANNGLTMWCGKRYNRRDIRDRAFDRPSTICTECVKGKAVHRLTDRR